MIEVGPTNPTGTLGSDTNPFTGDEGIQDAIDAASDGDTIKVAGGTYDNIVFPTLSGSPVDLIILADDWPMTGTGDAVIDGTSSSSQTGVLIAGGQTQDTRFSGFVVTNWAGLAACAIKVHPHANEVDGVGASPTIDNCTS